MYEILKSPYLLLAIGNFLTAFLFRYMHRTFYDQRPWTKRWRFLYTFVYIAVALLLLLANSMEIPVVNLVSSFLSYIVPLYLCYEVKNLRGLANYCFYFLGVIALEIVLSVSVGALKANMGMATKYDQMTPQISVIMNLCEVLMVLFICRFSSKEKGKGFDKVTFLFMLMPLLSLALIIADVIMLAYGRIEGFNADQFMRTAILMMVVNLTIFIILEKYTELMHKEAELAQEKLKAESDADIMKLSTKNMRERLRAVESVIQQDRLMRHDRRHFEALMYSLLEDGKIEEAKECLEQRLALEPQPVRRFCENTTVNAAISHYVSLAEAKDIVTEIAADIPALVNIDETELAITISNLMENAIHAAEKVEDKERFLKMKAHYHDQLLLEISNSYTGSVEMDENGYPITGEEGHGIGTRSVLAFVNKSGGAIYYVPGKDCFSVRLLIG